MWGGISGPTPGDQDKNLCVCVSCAFRVENRAVNSFKLELLPYLGFGWGSFPLPVK